MSAAPPLTLPLNLPLNLNQIEAGLRSHLQTRQLYTEKDTLSLLAHGEANAIFRLSSDRLVRVAVNTPNQRFQGDFSRVTAFEEEILRYLKGSKIGHRLLDVQLTAGQDFPYTYLVTNYIAGEPLNYGRQHLQLCANTLARLHRLPLRSGYENPAARLVPPLHRVSRPLTLFFEEAQSYAQPYFDFPQADAEIVAMLKSVLLKARSRLSAEKLLIDYPYECLVHSDHTYDNWVVDDQQSEAQAFLIDWEWAEVGSPAGDLGHFLSPITICRRQGYQMPAKDKQFFLEAYYSALENTELAQKIKMHFAAFGAFPALRSLCWTAGYWVTARRWYADSSAEGATENAAESAAENNSAAERIARQQSSQQAFPQMWAEVMALLEKPLP